MVRRTGVLMIVAVGLLWPIFGATAVEIDPVTGRPIHGPGTETSTAPGYCSAVASSQFFEVIQGINFGFTATGGSISVSVGILQNDPGSYGAGEFVNAWVDFNGDQVFEPEEQVLDQLRFAAEAGFPGTLLYGSAFALPENRTAEPTWMRVTLSYGVDAGPCGSWTFGSVRDFEVLLPPLPLDERIQALIDDILTLNLSPGTLGPLVNLLGPVILKIGDAQSFLDSGMHKQAAKQFATASRLLDTFIQQLQLRSNLIDFETGQDVSTGLIRRAIDLQNAVEIALLDEQRAEAEAALRREAEDAKRRIDRERNFTTEERDRRKAVIDESLDEAFRLLGLADTKDKLDFIVQCTRDTWRLFAASCPVTLDFTAFGVRGFPSTAEEFFQDAQIIGLSRLEVAVDARGGNGTRNVDIQPNKSRFVARASREINAPLFLLDVDPAPEHVERTATVTARNPAFFAVCDFVWVELTLGGTYTDDCGRTRDFECKFGKMFHVVAP